MKVLRRNGETVEIGFEEKEGQKAFWHTSAHVLAQAVKRLLNTRRQSAGWDRLSRTDFTMILHFPFPSRRSICGRWRLR